MLNPWVGVIVDMSWMARWLPHWRVIWGWWFFPRCQVPAQGSAIPTSCSCVGYAVFRSGLPLGCSSYNLKLTKTIFKLALILYQISFRKRISIRLPLASFWLLFDCAHSLIVLLLQMKNFLLDELFLSLFLLQLLYVFVIIAEACYLCYTHILRILWSGFFISQNFGLKRALFQLTIFILLCVSLNFFFDLHFKQL